jgi:hypothetical protein
MECALSLCIWTDFLRYSPFKQGPFQPQKIGMEIRQTHAPKRNLKALLQLIFSSNGYARMVHTSAHIPLLIHASLFLSWCRGGALIPWRRRSISRHELCCTFVRSIPSPTMCKHGVKCCSCYIHINGRRHMCVYHGGKNHRSMAIVNRPSHGLFHD